jgi:hypothetical protein
MNGYFATLGMKAIGSASTIRIRREPLYGSAHFADRINPDRDFSDTAASYDIDGVESVFEAAAAQPGSAAIALQRAQAPVGEGRSHAAAPEARHTPDSRAAPATTIQNRELQQRLEGHAAASDGTVGDLAPRAEDPRRREVPSPAHGIQPKVAADREDTVAPPMPVLRAGRDRPPPDFKGVDWHGQRPVAQQELQTIPIDAIARRSGDASADAARSPHAKKAPAAKSIAVNSPPGASTAADQARNGLRAQPGLANRTTDNAGPRLKAEATGDGTVAVEPYVEQPGPARKNRASHVWYRPLEIDADLSATRDESSGSSRPEALTVDAVKLAEKSPLPAVTSRHAHLQTLDRPAASRTRGVPDDAPPAVQVSIGRIEIREQRPAPTVPARRVQPPRLDLKEYLNRRLRGGRHE